MTSKQDEIIVRLQETIGSWNEDVTGAQMNLARQISDTKRQLDTLVQILAARSPGGTQLPEALKECERLGELSAEQQEALAKAARENIDLSSQLEPLKKRMSELRLHNDDQIRANRALREEMAALHRDGADGERVLQAENKVAKLQGLLAKRGMSLDGAVESAEMAESEIRDLQEKVNQLEASLTDQRDRASEATLAEAKARTRLLGLEAELTSTRDKARDQLGGALDDTDIRAEVETLRMELSQAHEEVEQTRTNSIEATDLALLREQNETLESEVLEYAGQVEDAQEQIARLNDSLEESSEELSAMSNARQASEDGANAEVELLRRQLAETNSSLIHAKGDIETLGAQLEEQSEELESAHRLTASNKTKEAERENDRKRLSDELSELRLSNDELSRAHEALHENMGELSDQHDETMQQKDQLAEHVVQMEQELTQNAESFAQTRSLLAAELEEAGQQRSELEASLGERETEVAQLEGAYDVQIRELQELQEDITGLSGALEDKSETMRGLDEAHVREVAALREELQLQKEEIEEATFAMTDLQLKFEEAAARENSLQKRIATLDAEADAHRLELDHSAQEISALEGRLRNQLDSEKSFKRELEMVRARLAEAEEAKRMADEWAELSRDRSRESTRLSERNESTLQSLQSDLEQEAEALRTAHRNLAAQTVRAEQMGEENKVLKIQIHEQQATAEERKQELRRDIARLEETLHAQQEELAEKHQSIPQWVNRMEETSTAARILLTQSNEDLAELKAELLTYEAFLLEQDMSQQSALSVSNTLEEALGEFTILLRSAKLEDLGDSERDELMRNIEHQVLDISTMIEQLSGINASLRDTCITLEHDERGRLTSEALLDPAQTRRLGTFLASKGILPEAIWAQAMADINQGETPSIGAILLQNGLSGEEALRELVAGSPISHQLTNDSDSGHRGESTQRKALEKITTRSGKRIRQLESELGEANRLSADYADQVTEQEKALEKFSHDLTALLRQAGDEETHQHFVKQLDDEHKQVEKLKAELAERDAELMALQENQNRVKEVGEDILEVLRSCAFEDDGRRRTIGEILLAAELINNEQLTQALEEQRDSADQRLGTILVDKGMIKEKTVSQVVASQLSLPFLDLSEAAVDTNAARLITGQFAISHQCIPIRIESGELTLAMANPLDGGIIEELQFATDLRILPVVSTPADISSTIGQIYAMADAGGDAEGGLDSQGE